MSHDDLPRLEKQPWEERTYAADFSVYPEIADSLESIVSVTEVVVSPSGELTVSDITPIDADIDSINERIQMKITGGVDGTLYKFTFKVVTSAGHKIEGDAYLELTNE